MRKLLALPFLILTFAFLSVVIPTPASAQVCSEGEGTANCDPLNTACTGSAASSPLCQRDPDTNPISGTNGILLRVTTIVAYVVGIVCIIIIVAAGIRYILSQGDASTVSGAKNQILYALIGLIVVIVARNLIVFVISRL